MVNSQNTAENLESLLNDWGNRPLIPPRRESSILVPQNSESPMTMMK